MIRHSPAERYLIFLVTHPTNPTNDQVIDCANAVGLAWLSKSYLDRLRRDRQPPDNYEPMNKEHLASAKFLSDNKITQLYFPTPTSRAWMSRTS